MIRRSMVVSGALLLLLVGGMGSVAEAAAPYPPPANGQGKAAPDRVKQGHCTTFTGDGFQADAQLEIYDDSAHYGTTTSDAKGTFSSRVCFANDARVGDHTLSADGPNDATMPGDPAERQVT